MAGADPQLDVNVLIRTLDGEPEFIAYVRANQAAGLSYTVAAKEEFLASGVGTEEQLEDLEKQYAVRLRADVTELEIDEAAARLQKAFRGDRLNRVLHAPDARVAAGAFVKNEPLVTADLQLFKRCRDLGLHVEFIGDARAKSRAVAYVPQLVAIPQP